MAKSTPGTSASKGSAQTIPNRGFRPPPISRPMPRPPMRPTYGSGATNFYRRPSYSYGVPTGLSALLSGQQSPFGRMVDPATGFPQRSSPRPVMGRPDFGQIGRSTSSGKSGSKGGARTVNPGSGDVQVSDVFMDAVESAPSLGNNPPPSPAVPEIGITPRGGQDAAYNRARKAETGSPTLMMDAGQYRRTGRGVPSIPTQGLPERPMIRSQGPESLRGGVESNLMFGERGSSRNADGSLRVSQPIMARPGDYLPPNPEKRDQSPRYQALRGRTGLGSPPVVTARRQVDLMPALAPPSSPITPDVRQQIEREIQMERAGVRPNVRPTMNVGKATGGPVGIHSGIASLVGRR
jgi:hypothetical protein